MAHFYISVYKDLNITNGAPNYGAPLDLFTQTSECFCFTQTIPHVRA